MNTHSSDDGILAHASLLPIGLAAVNNVITYDEFSSFHDGLQCFHILLILPLDPMLGSRGMRGKFGHCRRSQTTLNSELGFHALPVSGSRSESSTLGSEVSSLIYMSDAYNPLSNSLVFASIPVFQSIMSLMINSFQTILFVVGCQYA